MIKETLGLGNIIKQFTTTHRYVVQDKKGLELIVSLFNGNLILPSRKRGFLTFLHAYNELVSSGRIVLDKQLPIFTNTLDNIPIVKCVSFPCFFPNWKASFVLYSI